MRRSAIGMAILGIAFMVIACAVADDTDTAKEITGRLKREQDVGNLRGFDINLQVEEGKVVLRGFVSSEAQEQVAIAAAEKAGGVTDVCSELEIRHPVRTDDHEIASCVARKLAEHKKSGLLKDFRIGIDSVDGTVTLDGTISSEQQRQLALQATRSTSGVERVVDQMTLQEPATVEKSDASIAREIAAGLKQSQVNGDLEGFAIDMSVLNGIVTYTGEVSTQEQIDIAMSAARKVDGVKNILNQLAVAEACPEPHAPIAVAQLPRMEANVTPTRAAPEPVATVSAPASASRPAVENAIYRRDAEQRAEQIAAQQAARRDALDQKIGQQLMSELKDAKQRGDLRGFGIGVHVKDSVVRLTGRVCSPAQQQMALAIASDIGGVSRVVDELKITEPETTQIAGGQGGEAQSLEIAQTLGARLQEQESLGRLRGCDFDVKVEQSKVLLRGQVASTNQQLLLLEVARQTSGVSEVQADLAVRSMAVRPGMAMPVSVNAPLGPTMPYMAAAGPHGHMGMIDQTPRPIGAGRMVAYGAAAALAAPLVAVNQLSGGGAPAHMPGAGQAVVPARYDHPNLPGYAWPSYAAHPNYAAVTYPKQYSPTAWPYIGPFYPYPQVPLGWRKVTLKWDDGWWQLNFNSK